MEGLAHLQQPQTASDGADKSDKNGPLASGGSGGGEFGGFMAGLSHLRKSEPETEDQPATPSAPSGSVGAGLMAGLSRALAPMLDGEEHSAVDSAVDAAAVGSQLKSRRDDLIAGLTQFADDVVDAANEPDKAKPQGFLDVWIEADAEFIADKLQKSMQQESGGSGWKRRPLRHATEAAKEEPEVAELATLVADLFDKSRGRADCFATAAARGAYSDRVLGAGLRQVVSAIRERWNGLDDPLKEAHDAAVILETLEEICRFIDRFPLSSHFVVTVDDAISVRLGMLDRLADALVGSVRLALRQLHTDTCCFSETFAPPFMVLVKRLRPSNFLVMAQKCLGSLGDLLLRNLLWHAPFSDREHMSTFVANCRDDLRSILLSVLDANELTPLQQLWDGCNLLALPEAEALQMLGALRHVKRCSPSHALQSVQSSSEPVDHVNGVDDFEPPVVGEVLRQRRAEVFAAAGIRELSVTDAITVLGKRPELAGNLSDLQDAAFSSFQDLMPAPALAQLGAEALQQLNAAPIPTAAIASSAAAAAGAAHAAAETARMASTQLRSHLPGRLFSSVGQVASTLRPLGAADVR
jgi:hypothetical protein